MISGWLKVMVKKILEKLWQSQQKSIHALGKGWRQWCHGKEDDLIVSNRFRGKCLWKRKLRETWKKFKKQRKSGNKLNWLKYRTWGGATFITQKQFLKKLFIKVKMDVKISYVKGIPFIILYRCIDYFIL